MRCVPACRECREAGSCHRGELPASAYLPPAPPPKRRRAAVKPTATAPVPGPVFTKLECGHWTTREAQLFFSLWRPIAGDDDKSLCFCESCSEWKLPQPQPPVTVDKLPGF